MQFAAQLRCRIVIINAMSAPADQDSREAHRIHDVLDGLARFGNHVGVTLTLTPVGESPAGLIALLGQVRQGPIAVDFDPAACVRNGRDPIGDFREYADFIGHLQVRDALRSQDGGKETAVGRGEVDWPELLALVQEIGYQGWLTARRTEGQDPIGDVTRAVEYVRRVAMGG
jgi:sugar phosphate isomerase/epimerase